MALIVAVVVAADVVIVVVITIISTFYPKGKGKVDRASQESVGGCSSPSPRP